MVWRVAAASICAAVVGEVLEGIDAVDLAGGDEGVEAGDVLLGGVGFAPVPSKVLTVPEMAKRLRRSRFAVYLLIKKRTLPAFRALYRAGPWRFILDSGGAPRPLPHLHPREPGGVPWVTPWSVAKTLRVSARLVQTACLEGTLEARRSPRARRRARFTIAIDERTGLPLPKGTLVLPSRR